VGEDPASVTYVRNKQNDSAEVGMESRTHAFGDGVSQEELAEVVEGLNEDPEVSGFFIQLPLPEGLDPQPLVSRIRPAKDVDGLNPESAGRLSAGLPSLLPCTPHGIVQLLRRHDVPLEGREAVVLGRSNLVGKPMAQLLLRENATVTVCHSRTGNLAEVAARGDVLIVALGRREMVGAEYVKEGAVVVDVGIHRKDGGGLVGDVRFAEVETKASAVTPVPGGVGPHDPGDAPVQHPPGGARRGGRIAPVRLRCPPASMRRPRHTGGQEGLRGPGCRRGRRASYRDSPRQRTVEKARL
jgi:methylenetetrahydrofolate dehydrogenase (NADP+)/methenyltetrahydrofolate cyclohydrolase